MKHRMTTEERIALSVRQRRERERRLWRTAFLLSAVVHLLVFFFWRHETVLVSPFSAAGPKAGDASAAQGSMQAMNLRPPEQAPIIPPPVPLPTLIAEVEPVEVERERVDVSGLDGMDPGLEAPGLETGEGRGDGGTAEEGLNRLVPPSPRGMIIPPSDDDLRGRQVEVWVFVNERGRVVPDSTRLRPPTPDRDFNRRLIREAAEWVFEPARKGGVAVASWFPYTISMD